ncbi:MAG TPA: hypothetical protein VF069_03225 [Streptosporangiaceae bacterium]
MTGAVAGGSPPAGQKRRLSPPPRRPLAAAIAVACAGTMLTGIGYAVAGPPAAGAGRGAATGGHGLAGISGTSGPSPAAPAGGPRFGAGDLAAVDAILARRARALRTGDLGVFRADVAPALRPGQRELFAGLRRLPLATWRQRADPAATPVPVRGPAGRDAWTLRITVRYRLRGFDHTDTVDTQYLTFARAGGRLSIVGDGTAQGLVDDPEIWADGPLSVVRGRHSLVIGTGGQGPRLRQIAALLDRAVPGVTGVVGAGWARRAVALVPATDAQAAALADDGPSLREIAAVATVTRGAGGGRGSDRIVVSPAGYPRLNEIGRHVVLTHELTHIATRAAADARTPAWLVEGFADYVGYKGLDVPVASAARELRREVAGGRLPSALPGPADFSGASGRLPQAYEEAWLACRMVAGRYGEERLVRLYRVAGARPGEAFRRVLGVDAAEFTSMWRDYLRRELG